MTPNLQLPIHRRVIGATFVILFFVIGFVELFNIDTMSDMFVGPVSLTASGILLVIAGIVCWPFVLFPCIFDRFPRWVHGLPEATIGQLKWLLGAK